MTYILLFIALFTIFFLAYFFIKSRQIEITTTQAGSMEQIEFINKLKITRIKLNLGLGVGLGILFIAPALYFGYETNFKFSNLPEDRYQARMSDVYLMIAVGLAIAITIHFIIKKMFDRMTAGLYNIVQNLNTTNFKRVSSHHTQLSFFDKMLHPMILDGNTWWVFKLGRINKINIHQIEKWNYQRGFKSGMTFTVYAVGKRYYFLVSNYSYATSFIQQIIYNHPHLSSKIY